jgi:hypothetical protein
VAPACSTCNSPPVVAYSAPAPAPACQTQQCTTNYVQRSFYQPVTTYESRSYYEPVTTMQTSYYYEAVTSYQTSYYPDPCHCGCYVAKCSPVTSYQLKQQSCPVQSWVQRCAQVPVQSYKLSYYYEPQTTCCNTTIGAPVAAPPSSAPSSAPPSSPSYYPPPSINEQRTPPPGPSVGSSSFQPHTMTSNPSPPASAWQPAAPRSDDVVQGQIVRNDRAPTANTQVYFVNAATGVRHSATTNEGGRFQLTMASGQYHVYLASGNGSAAYHSQINVDRNQPINLVNN